MNSNILIIKYNSYTIFIMFKWNDRLLNSLMNKYKYLNV